MKRDVHYAIVYNFDDESEKDKADIGQFLSDSCYSKKRIVCNGLSVVGLGLPSASPFRRNPPN